MEMIQTEKISFDSNHKFQTERSKLIIENTGSLATHILNMSIEQQIACVYLIQTDNTQNITSRISKMLVYQMSAIEYITRNATLKLKSLMLPTWILENFDFELFTAELQFSNIIKEIIIDDKPWTIVPNINNLVKIFEGKIEKPHRMRLVKWSM